MGAPGPRRMAREAAVQVLYAADLTHGLAPEHADANFDAIAREFSLPARARDRARELVAGVATNLKRVDEAIARASANWQLHRLAAVDRNILRVAAYELLFEPDTPLEVVIDEAVEVARRFSGATSPAFVNGVLDLLARQRGEGKGDMSP